MDELIDEPAPRQGGEPLNLSGLIPAIYEQHILEELERSALQWHWMVRPDPPPERPVKFLRARRWYRAKRRHLSNWGRDQRIRLASRIAGFDVEQEYY